MNLLIDPSNLYRFSDWLATSRGGRVALHLVCMLAGSDLRMHWQGIGRELFAN
jgi:hypothetical protein